MWHGSESMAEDEQMIANAYRRNSYYEVVAIIALIVASWYDLKAVTIVGLVIIMHLHRMAMVETVRISDSLAGPLA
jgi:hypothetical protein